MDRKTKICLWTIVLGLANFLAYVALYVYFYGEAVNGRVVIDADGIRRYFLQSGQEVSRAAFVYSGIHSISIWPTVAAILLAMLTLAKDRVVASMRSAVVRGREFITIVAVVVALLMALLTFEFARTFVRHLRNPEMHAPAQRGALEQHPGRDGGE